MRCGFWRDLYREHERAEIGHRHLYPADVHPQRQQSEPSDRRWYRDLQLNPASPDQIDCGPTCSASYGYGTVVTLTATPGFLSIFDSWNGCDTVSDTICTVTVNAARSVTANFLP